MWSILRAVGASAVFLLATACGSAPTPGTNPQAPLPSETTASTTSSTLVVPPVTTTVPPAPPPVTKTQAPPRTTTTTKPASVYYANCSAAKAAGAAPLHRGEPGYRAALDRDNDGVACE